MFRLILAAVILCLPSAFARAAHPLITDDTGTQGAGSWQLALQADFNRHNFTVLTGAGPVAQRRRVDAFTSGLTYGLRDNLDMALGVVGHSRQQVAENGIVSDDASGRADTALELKWRFHERGGAGFALKPAVLFPTGDETRRLGTGRLSCGLNLIASYDAQP